MRVWQNSLESPLLKITGIFFFFFFKEEKATLHYFSDGQEEGDGYLQLYDSHTIYTECYNI